MNKLKEYTSIEDSIETLYSIYIYNKKVKEVINYFEDELEKAKKINNPIKKNKINNRLFNFIKYLNDNYEEESLLNVIFLLHDKIIPYILKKVEIEIAEHYNFPKIFVKCDTKFLIDYFIDLFYNLTFIYAIKINKNEYSIIKLNSNKMKIIEHGKVNNEQKIVELIDNIRNTQNYKDFIIIIGNVKIPSNIKNIIFSKDLLNNDAIYLLYENEIMKENNILLRKRLDELKNENTNLDLFVFGKLKFEIKDAIESYALKELYIETKKLENLKKFIDNEFLNFKIIPIKSLENGDDASIFIKDYNGLMGIKYF
jgi:hypothetical protein